jgi:hypothetical protein
LILKFLEIPRNSLEKCKFFRFSNIRWRKNGYKKIDQSLCAFSKGSSSIGLRAEKAKILQEKYNKHIKIYTGGSKKDEKDGCAVIKPDQKLKKD